MGHLHLMPHVSFAMVGGRPVFLDISRDRYLALDPAAETAFHQARTSASGPADEDPAVARLLATGLFTLRQEGQPLAEAAIDIPVRGLAMSDPGARLRLTDLPEIWFLLSRARRALRSHRLQLLLAALERRRQKVIVPISATETAALASRFLDARALVPIRPSCLQDSLALGFWLARRSARPALVLGVKLDPFAAHCWVQTQAAILNDAPDVVAEFTPVLVIR